MKEIYVFLDWAMTISGLVINNTINKTKFNKFLSALTALENALMGKVKLCIVSGTTKNSASKRNTIIKNAFLSVNRQDVYQGIAYEYGGYFIDANDKFFKVKTVALNYKDRLKVTKISQKYNLISNPEYSLYLNFDGGNLGEEFNNFCNECKALKNLSMVYYNDPEGFGCDIKNPKLNKGEFVKWFLKNKNPGMLICGGDDGEDVKMVVNKFKTLTYFIGFNGGNYNKQILIKSFLSNLGNVEGIVEDLTNLSHEIGRS